jgi:hypothetical protein
MGRSEIKLRQPRCVLHSFLFKSENIEWGISIQRSRENLFRTEQMGKHTGTNKMCPTSVNDDGCSDGALSMSTPKHHPSPLSHTFNTKLGVDQDVVDR